MGHFQLRKPGESTMAEQLEFTGPGSFYVSPNAKNETPSPIRGSAIVSILGKNYPIGLTHKVKDYEDPELSATKWSYITNLMLSGDTPVPDSSIKDQDTGYTRASCGKTTYDSVGWETQTIIISKPYTTYQALLDKVGDFSGSHGGTTYSRGMQYMSLFTFTMYYKYGTDSGGTIVPPSDDGTPASNKARIPCRPDVSGAPDWIIGSSLAYIIEYKTSAGSSVTTRTFRVWSEFSTFWDNIQTDPAYYDAIFYYVWEAQVQFNSSLVQRGSSTVTVSEIDNGKGIGIHGAKPLYLIISQQEGFVEYNIGSMPVGSDAFYGGYWHIDYNNIAAWKLAQHRLPVYQGTTPGDAYNGSCQFHPEFKIRTSINAGRGAPADVYTESGVPLAPDAGGFVLKYQYIGKPVIFGMYKDSPLGKEIEYMKPYYKRDDSNDPEAWLPKEGKSRSLLGTQLICPFKLNDGGNGLVFKEGLPYLGGVFSGNHYSLQMIPLRMVLHLGNEYGWAGQGVNEVTYFNNGNSAVTSTDLINRALFAEYVDVMDPTKNSYGTMMSRKWEDLFINGEPTSSLNYLLQIMYIPVLHTDFYLENIDFPSGRSFGRLWFSPASALDNEQNEFILRQVMIDSPVITRI